MEPVLSQMSTSAFISRLALPEIRQPIKKNPSLDLQATLAMSPSLDTARNNSFQYDNLKPTSSQSCTTSVKSAKDSLCRGAAVGLMHKKCQYCRNTYHAQRFCSAKEAMCFRR